MDAQRGDVFATLIDRRSGATLETPAAANPEALLESWRAHLANRRAIFIGDAARARCGAHRTGRRRALGDASAVSRWRRRSRSSAGDARRTARRSAARARADLRAPARCRDRARTSRPRRDPAKALEERRSSSASRRRRISTRVLAIEEASFNNPTTREWYEGELKRPEVCFIYVLRTGRTTGRRLLRVLAGRRPGAHQQFGRST